jgi:opacity protein-like surface antigen
MRRVNGVLVGLLALFVAIPAAADVVPGSGEFHIFGGYMKGDELTEPVLGTEPELDDDFVFGARLAGSITDHWGIEGSLTYSPNSADNLPGYGKTDADVYFIDVSAINYINPDYDDVVYIVWGLGWASADFSDEDYIEDGDGLSLHAGIGGRLFVTDRTCVRLEARYRYVDELADIPGGEGSEHLNVFEFTVGVGWRWGGY